jgi:glutathione S-transferase
MKFYIFMGSPRAFKVMAVANHLGLDYELQQLDPTKGEHLSAAYAAVNPNKRIPAMEDEGFILWESNAITQYLASKKPEAGLLPPDGPARAQVNQWQFWDMSSWDPACAIIVFERLVKKMLGMGEPDPAKVQEGEQNFHRYAQILNDNLKGRKFVIGNTLTLADFSLGAWLNMAQPARFPLGQYEEIKRWHASLMELPAWRKALPAASR